MSEELKRCPFCGNSDNEEFEFGQRGTGSWIDCLHCETSGPGTHYSEIDAWNHRPREAALEKKLEVAIAALEELKKGVGNNATPCCTIIEHKVGDMEWKEFGPPRTNGWSGYYIEYRNSVENLVKDTLEKISE